jgi:hypothetical protein
VAINEIENRAMAIMGQFGAAYPDVKASLKERGGVYVVTLDYSFSNLDAEKQRTGREGLDTLMYALRGIGLPVHLELGYV